ncbi:MAG: translocation and assembly module lipoprotein TamL [Chitinophagaceae bacterium]
MLSGKPLSDRIILNAIVAVSIIVGLASCTIVKNYQPGKPFVYKTNINLIGNFSNDEKDVLVTGLEGQLDDSMQVRKLDKLLWGVMKNPPVYDSVNADKSIIFMRALLRSLGYFRDSIYYDHIVKQEQEDQLRTVVTFHVAPGKQVHLDSVNYNLRHPELQHITDSTIKQAFIKKGDPFAKSPISAEIDRLTDLYRNSGYLRFSRDELVGLWDTLDVSLLQAVIDPFEQLEILQKLRERRENPTASLEIRLRSIDSVELTRFYIGNTIVYPDYISDTTGLTRKVTVVEGITVVQHRNRFKPKIFPPNIYLPKDSLYRLRLYSRTINRLNLLGTWRMVNIDQVPHGDTVDFVIRLTPAKKYSFNTNLEGSINQSAIAGNLFGVGVNVGLQNRNFAKAANMTNSNLRYGIELGKTLGSGQFIQTQQVSFSHNIYFPRFVPGFKLIPENYRDNFRTLFSFTAANTERRLLYNLTTINGAWGYEFQRRKWLVNLKLPNIEYSYLNRRDSLDTLIKYNPSLRNIFTDGFIASVIVNVTLSGGQGNKLNVFRVNLEQSGLLTGILRNSFLDRHLYRFVKLDAEFAHLIRFNKSSVAFRGFAGAGYEFNSTRNPDKRNNLPFFKQYFSGGPNSMRAWALRRLGPGSTMKEFVGQQGTPDRYGDIQLEANAEYRFPIGKPLGIKVNGALFTDVGNVWFMKAAAGRPEEEIFKLSRLGKDIAIGAGGGLRIDFDFFVIRFDYSYRIKDPSPALSDAANQNKWFSYPFFKGAQFQLGIGYPFIF